MQEDRIFLYLDGAAVLVSTISILFSRIMSIVLSGLSTAYFVYCFSFRSRKEVKYYLVYVICVLYLCIVQYYVPAQFMWYVGLLVLFIAILVDILVSLVGVVSMPPKAYTSVYFGTLVLFVATLFLQKGIPWNIPWVTALPSVMYLVVRALVRGSSATLINETLLVSAVLSLVGIAMCAVYPPDYTVAVNKCPFGSCSEYDCVGMPLNSFDGSSCRCKGAFDTLDTVFDICFPPCPNRTGDIPVDCCGMPLTREGLVHLDPASGCMCGEHGLFIENVTQNTYACECYDKYRGLSCEIKGTG